MKKKVLILLSMLLMLSLVITGCSESSSSDSASSSGSESKGELNLFIWTEYVPESVIQDFEAKTGIKVNVSYYSSNEDLYSKIMAESEGAYDIVQPSDYMVEKLISQDKLQKLDKDKLTNLSNIEDKYMNKYYDKGNEYSVPYMCAMAGIAVDTSKIKDEITGYADLFDPKYAGQLVVLDDSRAVIGIAAKSLGYSMSTSDDKELEKIKEKLLTLKSNVKVFDSDSAKSELISGECALGFCYNAEIALAMSENPNIKYVYPKEGAYINEDNWCITKGAKNYDNAIEFINYLLDGEVSAKCSEELPYINPNKKAIEILGDEFTNDPAKNPSQEEVEKSEYIKNLDSAVLKKYSEMWTELKK